MTTCFPLSSVDRKRNKVSRVNESVLRAKVTSECRFTPEAIGFLSAVGVFVVLLTILFLFINKKLCFARVGGLPCFELRGHRKRKERSGIHQGLALESVHEIPACTCWENEIVSCKKLLDRFNRG
ncbi:synaptotagmin-16 isoform X2 [Tachysurus ichikawai]